ncbi:unnamed protein product [Symbiodinium microadriaticum]|nr:unnamed protein product [Symbiodinium microadriaticum]CAE7941769.1 unnamed protein product [Symbiodinium sp. KB8]
MFRHPNLVTLMGFARNGNQRFLVYELMEGGDLFNRIYDSRKGRKEFAWRDRLCVAFDAACGLSHLHFQTPKVFHRDIKSMNILLSRSGTAKVADFGLATISKKRGAHRTGSLAGTPGYMCPIYEKTCVITERSEHGLSRSVVGSSGDKSEPTFARASTLEKMIPLTLDPLPAFLIVFLLLVADKERRYFKNRPAPMVELPVPSPSPEVMIEADRQFSELRRSLIRMVMDVCGWLGILVLSAYTCRIICLGKDTLSCGEMSHVFLLVLWLLTTVAFHTGFEGPADLPPIFWIGLLIGILIGGGPTASDLRNLEAAFARLSIRLELAEERISALEEEQGLVTASDRSSPTRSGTGFAASLTGAAVAYPAEIALIFDLGSTCWSKITEEFVSIL